MDEVAEASIARCPAADIVGYADGFPPLFHLTLAGWSRVVPTPESGRWISVAAGVAAVYAVGRWARGLLGESGGVVAAGLAAVSPLHIYLSQEMRAYSMYLCFVAWALMFFFAALGDDRARNWAGFVLFMAAGVYTHYYAAAAGLVLGLVFVGRRRSWADLRRGAVAFAALFVICLPLAVLLLPNDVKYQGTYADKPSFTSTLAHTGYALWTGFSLGPSLRELHDMAMWDAAIRISPWGAVILAAGGALLVLGWRELGARTNGWAVAFLAVASAPIIGILGNAAGVGFKVQYWSWIVFPLMVWLAAGVVRGWSGRARPLVAVACAAVVGLQLLAVFNRAANPHYANEDLRSATALIVAEGSPTTPVFVAADYLAPVVRYYLAGPSALHNWLPHMPRHAVRAGVEAEARQGRVVVPISADGAVHDGLRDESAPRLSLDEALHSGREFWFVYSRPFHGDPQGELLKQLGSAGRIEPVAKLAGVDVYRVPAAPAGGE
jgi:hypothetical protein